MTAHRVAFRTSRPGDRGSSTIEVLGVVPIVGALVLCLVQVCFVAFAVLGANQAVRDGARAASLGRSAELAVDRSLPGTLDASVTTAGERVAVRVPVPRVKPFPQFVVERDARMPETDS